RRRRARSRAPLHAHARRREAELPRHHERDARQLPVEPEDARGVHDADRAPVTRALAARALELLGPLDGSLPVVGHRPHRRAAALGAQVPIAAGDVATAAVVTFLGAGAAPAERQALVASLGLPAGAPVVLLDHNQPRTPWRRVLGIAALALRG